MLLGADIPWHVISLAVLLVIFLKREVDTIPGNGANLLI